MDFKYIVPDILVSGGALPLQSAMEALAKGFFNFYSSSGWKSFVFMIYPICALLGLMGLSHKLSTGEETWGRGCSNFIWKVMLATGILVIAPNSPKYLTELINQTSSALRIPSKIKSSNDLATNPYISHDILPIIQENTKKLKRFSSEMSSPIEHYSKRSPDIYGEDVTFNSVTGLSNLSANGTGFPNVNFHVPSNEAGKVIPLNKIATANSEFYPLNGSPMYEIRVSPLSEALDECFERFHTKAQGIIDSASSESKAILIIKSDVLPLFKSELSMIRGAFIADYARYLNLEKTVSYYTKLAENPDDPEYATKIMSKLNSVYSKFSKDLYKDLMKFEEKSKKNNELTKLPSIFFNFSMIFVWRWELDYLLYG